MTLFMISLLTNVTKCDMYGTRAGSSKATGIELCKCPPIPTPINYVAVEVPKPVRVTTIPAPHVGPKMIPVVLPPDSKHYKK